MIYETKNHWFIKENKKIELTNLEHKLLIALSRKMGSVITYRELAKKVYGNMDKYAQAAIRILKHRLYKKTKLRIDAKNNEGYILKTEIYFK